MTKYALIDIESFNEKATMVKGIYQYITQSAWSVTSLSASQFLGVGLPGAPPVDASNNYIYTAWINGSTYIQDFCLLNDNVSIYKSLEIKEDLIVRGNTTYTNITTFNASITNASITNASIINIDISSSNIYTLNVIQDILLGGNITSYSDIKLKNNIVKLTDCLNKIDTIHGYSYTRNDLSDVNKQYIGLIAQEVELMYPELISDKDNIKSINYQSITAILVECVKELKCEINKLKS